ncbi:hypothetical protein DCO16_01725 [Polynucleobacter antarcticus]|uniref:Oligosaccharide repeat unit polymerase n=1 Tax=Polynucleobacter antarcticus TaxID=1743162 RepID=A0A6M9PPS6_9BURK|nr:O-antigen polymerase [Polynucleobacter antarcticus]QKM61912.1 hypothetical protein DCO16_01725 [Polynucleobacter antarcticus]
MKLEILRPDYVFALLWTTVFGLAYADLYWMGFDYSLRLNMLIGSNIAGFFIIYNLCNRKIINNPHREINVDYLFMVTKFLFFIWSILFIINIYFSNGIPFIWSILKVNKSYVDFGVPTLSGFANMLRILTLCIICYQIIKKQNSKIALLYLFSAILIGSSLLELARGNTIFLLFSILGFIFVGKFFNRKFFIYGSILIALFSIIFGYVEKLRSPQGSGGEAIMQYQSVLNRLPYGFTSTYLYVTTPISNLYYSDTHPKIEPLGFPYHSAIALVPTIVREKIFHKEYGSSIKLRRESHNATSFYAPLLDDFNFYITFLIVSFMQFSLAFTYIKARNGSFFYRLVYGPLFASLLLSIFYNYFLTLFIFVYCLSVYGLYIFYGKYQKHN